MFFFLFIIIIILFYTISASNFNKLKMRFTNKNQQINE